MKTAGKTDIGLVRNSNQDAFAILDISQTAVFAVVCDGMGGVNGGEVASSMAINIITDKVSEVYRDNMTSRSVKNMLNSAITNANITVYDIAHTNKTLDGMGTTIVAAMIMNKTAHIAHIGDSRVYLISDKNKIQQITKDHSIVQQLIETGQLQEGEAKNHPRRNIITKALGVCNDVEMEYNEFPLNENDILLLCTDGITGFIEEKEILSIIQTNEFRDCPQKLIKKANEHGGSDNSTVVLIEI